MVNKRKPAHLFTFIASNEISYAIYPQCSIVAKANPYLLSLRVLYTKIAVSILHPDTHNLKKYKYNYKIKIDELLDDLR